MALCMTKYKKCCQSTVLFLALCLTKYKVMVLLMTCIKNNIKNVVNNCYRHYILYDKYEKKCVKVLVATVMTLCSPKYKKMSSGIMAYGILDNKIWKNVDGDCDRHTEVEI